MNEFDCGRIERNTFISRLHYAAEMTSTSDIALSQAADSAGGWPLLVLTDHQTSGRGRGGNQWWSNRGAITFSLVLPGRSTGLPPARWPQLSLHVALAVGETLSAFAPQSPVGLKWPNDVFLARRKACGILLEVPPKNPDCLVIGVGLNVNNSLENSPPELRETATSLVDETGTGHDRTDVLIRLLCELEREIGRLADGSASLADRWNPLCLVRGRSITHRAGDQLSSGHCLGVDDDGSLLLETQSGRVSLYGGTLVEVEGLRLNR